MTAPAVVGHGRPERPAVPVRGRPGHPTVEPEDHRNLGPASPGVIGAGIREQVVRLQRAAPLGAVLLTGLVAHVAVAPHLAVGGAAPDVLLVGVAAVAAVQGRRAGAAFGFAAGLGADLFLATPLGTSALAFTLVGHVLGGSGPPRSPSAAAALCNPASSCFACRTGRGHGAPPAGEIGSRPTRARRRAAARRATLRRTLVVTSFGVAAGRLGTAAAATALGGAPFPDRVGILRMAAVAVISAPLGPTVFAAVRRVCRRGGFGRRPAGFAVSRLWVGRNPVGGRR